MCQYHQLKKRSRSHPGAANVKQLADYYAAVTADERDTNELTFVFLTPNMKSNNLTREFNNLKLKNANHRKYWIYWNSSEISVVSIIQGILTLESTGLINPINEYIRHTLKAFAMHCTSTTDTKFKTMRTGEDIGEIVDEAEIKTKTGRYRVIKRDSSQIQVFNIKTGDKEVARYILAEYIDENRLSIPHEELNTRTIGKKFFDYKNDA